MQTTCGLKGWGPGYRFDTESYDHFQLLYILEGELSLIVQNVVIVLRPDMVCIMPAGSAYRLRCETVGYRGVYANLLGELPEEYCGKAAGLPASPALRMVAGLIAEEVCAPGHGTESVLQHLAVVLADLGIRLVQAGHEDAVSTAESWVEMARRRIERTIYSGQSLRESLAGVPLSYRQLARHFQAVLGVTPKQYQQQCRLQEAERLLRTTRQSITSIALELGFNSSQHFSALFRRETGQCPSSCR